MTAGSAGAGSGAAGAPAPASTVTGMVTFTNLGPSVEMAISLTGCTSGKSYPIHIHEGMSCSDAMSQGAHWDPPRGENIPNVPCMNAVAVLTYSREYDDPKPWSVGGPAESNVVNHVVVLHDPDDPMKRIACGQIKAQ